MTGLDFATYRGAVLEESDLYALPEGTVLWKPDLGGWTLFLKRDGGWSVVDAYDRDRRGELWSSGAVGTVSPGYVLHTPPAVGYYSAPKDETDSTPASQKGSSD